MKTRFIMPLLASTLTICMPLNSSAQVPDSIVRAPQAQLDDQTVLRELAHTAAPIKSNLDMNTLIAFQYHTPLDKLSPTGKQDFLNSLDFGERGLVSFRTDILEAELTPTEIYSILSLFGFQNSTPQLDGARAKTSLDRAVLQLNRSSGKVPSQNGGNYGKFGSTTTYGFGGTNGGWGGDGDDSDFLENYRCESAGTCVSAHGYACTSNC